MGTSEMASAWNARCGTRLPGPLPGLGGEQAEAQPALAVGRAVGNASEVQLQAGADPQAGAPRAVADQALQSTQQRVQTRLVFLGAREVHAHLERTAVGDVGARNGLFWIRGTSAGSWSATE